MSHHFIGDALGAATKKLDKANATFEAAKAITARKIGGKSELEDEKAKLQLKVSKLKSDKSILEIKLSNLELVKSTLEEKVSHLDSDKSLLATRVSQLESENSKLEPNVSETHLDSIKSLMEIRVAHLESDKSKLEAKVSQLESDKLKLEIKLSDLESNKLKLETRVSHSESETSKLNATVFTLESSKSTLEKRTSDLESENSKLKTTSSDLELDKSRLETRVSQLENDKRKMETEQTQSQVTIQGLNDKVQEINKQLKGKQNHMIPAKQLCITWGDNIHHWIIKSSPDSTHGEVAELLGVNWFDVSGSILVTDLTPNVSYSAYLVFKLKAGHSGFDSKPYNAFIGIRQGERSARNVMLVAKGEGHHPEGRIDGWMEIKLGHCFVGGNDDGTLEMGIYEVDIGLLKMGLVIQGIEIRPR